MKAKLDTDPIINLYDILYDVITRYHTKGIDFEEVIDPLLFKILVSGACILNDEKVQPKTMSFDLINSEIQIIFVTNMMGNAASEYKDFIDIYGTKYIIIFLDYFDGIKDKRLHNIGITDVIGNFNYVNAIASIVRFVISIIKPMGDNLPMTCCAGMRYYRVPIIIATKIINDILAIDPELDLPMSMEIPWNELKDIIEETNANIELSLIGINCY